MSYDPAELRRTLIHTTLQAAVPLRIAELAQHSPEDRERLRASMDAHDFHADDAMFAGTHAAEGVRNIITALALLAFAEGGVNFDGLHFCADHSRCFNTERMIPACDGYWIREEVAADHPGRTYTPMMDGHFLHRAIDLDADGWSRDGDNWVRTHERTGDGWMVA